MRAPCAWQAIPAHTPSECLWGSNHSFHSVYTHGGSEVVVVDVAVVVVAVSVVLVKVVVVEVFVVVVGMVRDVSVVLVVLDTFAFVVFTGISYFSIHVVEASDSWKGKSPGFFVRLMGRIGSSAGSVVVSVVAAFGTQLV